MSFIGKRRITGSQYALIVLAHCAECFSFFEPAWWELTYCDAYTANVTLLAASTARARHSASRALNGSSPLATTLRCSAAHERVSARPMEFNEPRPLSRVWQLPASGNGISTFCCVTVSPVDTVRRHRSRDQLQSCSLLPLP